VLTTGFQPPDVRIGQISYMIYEPHFSKKRGVWVPGAYKFRCQVDPNFDAFCARFQRPPDVYDEKGKIPAMSPGILIQGAEQRKNTSVEKVTLLGIDLDQGRADFDHVWKRIHETGVSALVHTTWSHLQAGKGERWRALIELTEYIPVKDWPRFWRAAMLMFCGDADGRLRADRACSDPARVYYVSGVAPGCESTYQAHRIKGVPLPPEEVWEAAGLTPSGGTSTSVSVPATIGDRVAAITTHRAMLAPGKRKISREDLEALAKDKKRVPDGAMRAAFRAAAAGSRMVIVKGEARGPVLTEARAAGLSDGDVDPFLTALMYRVAIAHRNAEPGEVEALFAASFTVLVEDDQAAGNTPYSAGALAAKFTSAVHKVDEEEVDRAEKLGIPTSTEFKAANGLEGGGAMVLRRSLFSGQGCYYKVRSNEDGDPDFVVQSNFTIEPTEKWRSALDSGMSKMEWRVSFISAHKGVIAVNVPLPNIALTSRADFLRWLSQFEGHQWEGAEGDTQTIGVLLDEEALEKKIPDYQTTPKMGIHIGQSGECHLVTPEGTYLCDGTLIPKLADSGLRYAPHMHDVQPNPKLFPDMRKRRVEMDQTKWARYAQLLSVAHLPEVIAPLISWFSMLPLTVHVKKAEGKYPLLQILAEPGAGKSTLASLLTRGFGGPIEGEVINEKPKFSLGQLLSGSTTFGMWFDEYKPSEGERRSRVGSQREVLRGVFNTTSDYRAGTGAFDIEAPVIISGEERLWGEGATRDQGLAERTVIVSLGPDSLDRAKNPALAGHIMSIGAEILALDIEHSGMWIAFQTWCVGKFKDEVPKLLLAAKRAADKACAAWPRNVPVRVRDAIAVLCAGTFVWEQWCLALGVTPPRFTPEQLARYTLEEVTGIDTATAKSLSRRDSAESDKIALTVEQIATTLDAMTPMQQMNVAQFTYLYEEDGKRRMFVNVLGLMEFYRNQHMTSEERVIKSAQHWHRVVKGSKYVIEAKARRDGTRGPRGSVIDVDAMLAADVDIGARLLDWRKSEREVSAKGAT